MEGKRIGALIRRARGAKGLTQVALADRAKIDRSQMNRIESGKGEIKGSQLLAIAEALGIPPGRLLDDGTREGAATAAESAVAFGGAAVARAARRSPDIFNDLAHLLEKGGELAENMMRLQLRTLDGILRDAERMSQGRPSGSKKTG